MWLFVEELQNRAAAERFLKVTVVLRNYRNVERVTVTLKIVLLKTTVVFYNCSSSKHENTWPKWKWWKETRILVEQPTIRFVGGFLMAFLYNKSPPRKSAIDIF